MGMINSDEMISENENEYFDLINKKKETTKESISSSTSQSISSIDKSKPIKYWKNVILHFLEKQNKLGITWCKELYQIIKAYQFTSEQKYLDSFFLQKFELKTKPKCLYHSQSISLNNSFNLNKSQNLDENLIKSSSSKTLHDLTSSQYISQMSKNEYEKNKMKLKEYIAIFKKHLKNKDHPISICIKLFVEIFGKEIQSYTDEIEDIKKSDEKQQRAKTVCAAICQQLVFYLFKLQKCFGYMYSSIFNFKYFENEKEEFTIMFSTEFFSHKKLYDLVLNLLTLEKEQEIYDFCKHILILNQLGIKPIHFGVDPKYCLDQDTIDFQLNFIKQKNIKLTEDELNEIKNYISKKDYIPYQTSIDLIKKVKLHQAPFDKMNVLYSMGNDVIENINNIWKPLEKF